MHDAHLSQPHSVSARVVPDSTRVAWSARIERKPTKTVASLVERHETASSALSGNDNQCMREEAGNQCLRKGSTSGDDQCLQKEAQEGDGLCSDQCLREGVHASSNNINNHVNDIVHKHIPDGSVFVVGHDGYDGDGDNEHIDNHALIAEQTVQVPHIEHIDNHVRNTKWFDAFVSASVGSELLEAEVDASVDNEAEVDAVVLHLRWLFKEHRVGGNQGVVATCS